MKQTVIAEYNQSVKPYRVDVWVEGMVLEGGFWQLYSHETSSDDAEEIALDLLSDYDRTRVILEKPEND